MREPVFKFTDAEREKIGNDGTCRAIEEYFNQRTAGNCGGFCTALLQGDLSRLITNAHEGMGERIITIVRALNQRAPVDSWGSVPEFRTWLGYPPKPQTWRSGGPLLNKHALPEELAAAVAEIVSYGWQDEERDYYANCGTGPDDNQRNGHIYQKLRLVDAWLEGEYGSEPKDPGDDPEMLAKAD